MKLTIFPSLYETTITETSTKTCSWTALAQRLQKPEVTADKNSAKMFSGATFKAGGRRCNDDIDEHHMLVLDYDDGVHPVWFQQEYGQYTYLLYSSYNNHWNKSENCIDTDVLKFRVVLPLAKPASAEHFQRMKPVLMKKFPDADPASFVPSQAFFLPSCHPDRREQFQAVYNTGELFDFNKFAVELWVEQQKQEFQNKRMASRREGQTHTPISEARELLTRMSADCGYDVWWKVGATLKNLYGEDGFDVWNNWSATAATYDGERKLRSKWNGFRDQSNYSYGYLVNRSREYPI